MRYPSSAWLIVGVVLTAAALLSLIVIPPKGATPVFTRTSAPALVDNVWKLTASPRVGSAFPVRCVPEGRFFRTTFLTAGHILAVEDASLAITDGFVALEDGRIERIHPERDVALVSFRTLRPIPPLPLDYKALEFGERIYLLAWPAGYGPFLTVGYVSREPFASAAAYPGSSGGALIRASNGAVAGILVSAFSSGHQIVDFMTMFEPLTGLEEWINAQ